MTFFTDFDHRMTVEEKISQMSYLVLVIDRKDIIPYEPNFENSVLDSRNPDYTAEENKIFKEILDQDNY